MEKQDFDEEAAHAAIEVYRKQGRLDVLRKMRGIIIKHYFGNDNPDVENEMIDIWDELDEMIAKEITP